MIRRDHPDLSLSGQCRLLSISRSSAYDTPQGESGREAWRGILPGRHTPEEW